MSLRPRAGLLRVVGRCEAVQEVQADQGRDRIHRVDDQANGVKRRRERTDKSCSDRKVLCYE